MKHAFNGFYSKMYVSLNNCAVVGAELPEAFFDEDRGGGDEELELRGRGVAETTDSVQTTPSETQKITRRPRHSLLESDDAATIFPPVFGGDAAGLTSPHDRRKKWSSPGAGKAAATTTAAAEHDHDNSRRRRRQLLDEASDAMGPVSTAAESTRDLVQKVLEQNARLKQLLRRIVDTHGTTVREFLVSCGV